MHISLVTCLSFSKGPSGLSWKSNFVPGKSTDLFDQNCQENPSKNNKLSKIFLMKNKESSMMMEMEMRKASSHTTILTELL